MIYVDTLQHVPIDALRADAQADGRWLVYMPGDTLPEIQSQDVATVTAQQFRDRFTDVELVAMLTSTDAGIKLLVLKIQTADPFPMSRPSVQQGLDYLVSKKIITAERREIVGALT